MSTTDERPAKAVTRRRPWVHQCVELDEANPAEHMDRLSAEGWEVFQLETLVGQEQAQHTDSVNVWVNRTRRYAWVRMPKEAAVPCESTFLPALGAPPLHCHVFGEHTDHEADEVLAGMAADGRPGSAVRTRTWRTDGDGKPVHRSEPIGRR